MIKSGSSCKTKLSKYYFNFMFMHFELMFTVREHVFMHRELVFIAREHNFSHDKNVLC